MSCIEGAKNGNDEITQLGAKALEFRRRWRRNKRSSFRGGYAPLKQRAKPFVLVMELNIST